MATAGHSITTSADIPAGLTWIASNALAVSILAWALVALVSAALAQGSKFPGVYFVNPKKFLEFSDSSRKKEFMKIAPELIRQGQHASPGKPFRAITEFGDTIILPSTYAHEIRNHPNLSFSRLVDEEFHGHLRGFECMKEFDRESLVLQNVLRKQLTQSVAKLTGPLSEEASAGLHELLGEQTEWRDIVLKDEVVRIVARLTSRAFLGPELARNPDWIRITSDFAVAVFNASHDLRPYPYYVRKIAQYWVHRCKIAREMVNEGERLIRPVIEQRRAAKRAAAAAGEPIPKYDDAIEWCEQEAKGVYYNPVNIQFLFSLTSISTTSDTLTKAMLDLAEHPELFEPLRREIIEVLGQGGLDKTSLYKLKLLDSFIKESQRLQPVNSVGMRRIATDKVKLSDGLVIPKGSRLVVTNESMRSDGIWENGDQFDPYRFMRMREDPGVEHLAHLVSTSPNHMGFGHGNHACPGRFFAANELKVLLCHLLHKYEWKLVPDSPTGSIMFGFATPCNPKAKISIRRRPEQELVI